MHAGVMYQLFHWVIGQKGMSVGFGRHLRKIENAIIGAVTLQIYFDWSSVLQFAYFNKELSAMKLIRI